MAIDFRPITPEEMPTFLGRIMRGFGEDLSTDPEEQEREVDRLLATLPVDRTMCAFDDADLVGTLGAFPFQLTVPGAAELPMAGTTVVTVQPTHRRRGVLTTMMRAHLDDAAEHEEPIAGLWASESAIYGRYGFGSAAESDDVETVQTHIEVSGPSGDVRLIEVEDASATLAPIYERVRLLRPGMLSRTKAWWENSRLYDAPSERHGHSALRVAIHESEGEPDGYALYAQKSDWGEGFGNGRIQVWEVIAPTPEAHTGLWRYLTNIDLFPRVKYWNMPVDDPLRWKVSDPRRLVRKRHDTLWIRILDVAAALSSRSYAADGSIMLEIGDSFRPDTAGTYELAVTGGHGECRPSAGDADVTLDVATLGSLYLGGGHAVAAARGGRISGSDDAVVMLGRMFRGDDDPWCPEVF